ncbi:MAG: PaaI family thioesterase [Candidatus Firestonebacteria bacterium]
MKWVDDGMCFVCGKKNPDGFKLDFKINDNKTITTQWTPEKKYQGYADIVHGGIIGVFLDETMVTLPWKLLNVPVASAQMTVRFKKPAKIGETLFFTGEIVGDINQKIINTKADAKTSDGTLIAFATGKCVRV